MQLHKHCNDCNYNTLQCIIAAGTGLKGKKSPERKWFCSKKILVEIGVYLRHVAVVLPQDLPILMQFEDRMCGKQSSQNDGTYMATNATLPRSKPCRLYIPTSLGCVHRGNKKLITLAQSTHRGAVIF